MGASEYMRGKKSGVEARYLRVNDTPTELILVESMYQAPRRSWISVLKKKINRLEIRND